MKNKVRLTKFSQIVNITAEKLLLVKFMCTHPF